MQHTAADEGLTHTLPVPFVAERERPQSPVRRHRIPSDVSVVPHASGPMKAGSECVIDRIRAREMQRRRKRPGAAKGQRVVHFSSLPLCFYKDDSKWREMGK